MHKARRHSFHTTDNAIQNHRSRPTNREPITHQRDEVTTFSAVGTTTVTIPAELQALISKPTS